MNKKQRRNSKLEQAKRELARYREKVGRQEAENAKLRASLKEYDDGLQSLKDSFSISMDALLAQVALKYGKPVVDDVEESSTAGQDLGMRLELDAYNASEVYQKYAVHANVDKEGKLFTVGVIERKALEDIMKDENKEHDEPEKATE